MKSLRKVRVESGRSGAQLAEELKPMFPRITQTGISYAENSQNTGLTITTALRREIEVITGAHFASAAEGRTDSKHMSFWVSDEIRELFDSIKKDYGLTTDKETFIQLIKRASTPA